MLSCKCESSWEFALFLLAEGLGLVASPGCTITVSIFERCQGVSRLQCFES